jgi:hypothetical protein
VLVYTAVHHRLYHGVVHLCVLPRSALVFVPWCTTVVIAEQAGRYMYVHAACLKNTSGALLVADVVRSFTPYNLQAVAYLQLTDVMSVYMDMTCGNQMPGQQQPKPYMPTYT